MSRDALAEVDIKGAFQRKPSTFRNWISSDEESKFKPESGRYHLFVAFACPWANRTLAVRSLKGLQDVIGVSVTHSTWQRTRPDDDSDQHHGWAFKSPGDHPVKNPIGHGEYDCEGCIPNNINSAKFVRDLYDMSDDTSGKYTVPVLWDTKENCIVNNESSDIIRILNKEFNQYAKTPDLDLCPSDLLPTIEEVNGWVYAGINNGVYRCGFAKSQEAYDEAEEKLFAAMDRVETILSGNRYICGDTFTEADVRLFMTLVRFDEVYVVYFKTNRRCVREYPNILNYCREVYQMAGMAETVNMKHIKMHYFTSHPTLNTYGVIPRGPDTMKMLAEAHDRNRKYPQTHP